MSKENKIEHWQNKSLENLQETVDGILYVEEWKCIDGYKGIYQISSFGRVKRMLGKIVYKKGGVRVIEEKILAATIHDKPGYLRIRLTKDKIKKNFYIHKLVASGFLQNPLKKQTVNHMFGDKKDNRAIRLEYATLSENILHAFKHNLRSNVGEDHPAHKLMAKDIPKIRSSKKSVKEIAKDFRVSIYTIYLVRRKKLWGHV